MKCQCNNPSQIKGYGIVAIGEIIELPDGMINDPIIAQNFRIIPGTVKTKGAKAQKTDDYEQKARERVLKEIGVEAMRDALIDAHITVKSNWSTEKILDLYIDEFGVLEERKREEAPEIIEEHDDGEAADQGEFPLDDPTDPNNKKK